MRCPSIMRHATFMVGSSNSIAPSNRRTTICKFVSSNTSLRRASSSSSPGSILPPGGSHLPGFVLESEDLRKNRHLSSLFRSNAYAANPHVFSAVRTSPPSASYLKSFAKLMSIRRSYFICAVFCQLQSGQGASKSKSLTKTTLVRVQQAASD